MKPLRIEQFPPFSVAVFPAKGRAGEYLKVDAAKPHREGSPGQYVILDETEVLAFVRTVLRAAGRRAPERETIRALLALLPAPPGAAPGGRAAPAAERLGRPRAAVRDLAVLRTAYEEEKL